MTNVNNHLILRETRKWGTYGIDGNQELKYLKISELSDGHLEAIIATQCHLEADYVRFLLFEQGYRAGRGIVVPEYE